jgi:hypothetical protein
VGYAKPTAFVYVVAEGKHMCHWLTHHDDIKDKPVAIQQCSYSSGEPGSPCTVHALALNWRSAPVVIQDRDGSIATCAEPYSDPNSFRTEIPEIEPEQLSIVIDRLLTFALDTLGVQHVELRVVAACQDGYTRSDAA